MDTAAAVSTRDFYGITLHRELFNVDVRYVNLKYIGGGAYGSVCAAEDKLTGRKVALKKCRDVFRDPMDAKRILRELKLLRLMGSHENLLWILDVFVWPNSKAFKDLYIVTDLMETDLSRIIESPQPLTVSHVKYFVYQMLRGLKFLHSAKILHRDLKPQNILVNSNCELVIGDFGLARVIGTTPDSLCAGGGEGGSGGEPSSAGSSGSMQSAHASSDPPAALTSYVVTRWYRAPELLVNSKQYGGGVDIWSIGCILAEMITRKPLLPGRNYQHQLQVTLDVLGPPSDEQLAWMKHLQAHKTVKAQVAAVRKRSGNDYGRVVLERLLPTADPQALDLLARMLCFDPGQRITVDEALKHPFVSDYHDPSDEPTSVPPPQSIFEFEDRGLIPKPELQAMMIEEMDRYSSRPADKPQSTRMSGYASTQTALVASSAGAAPAVPAQTSSGNGSSGSKSQGQAAAIPAKAATAEGGTGCSGGGGDVIAAITSQMQAMRNDILSAVDKKMDSLENRINAKLNTSNRDSGSS